MKTIDECLQKAHELCVSFEDELIIEHDEEMAKKGDILPAEFIFYEADLIKFIKFCRK